MAKRKYRRASLNGLDGIFTITASVAAVGVLGVGGYWFYRRWQNAKTASLPGYGMAPAAVPATEVTAKVTDIIPKKDCPDGYAKAADGSCRSAVIDKATASTTSFNKTAASFNKSALTYAKPTGAAPVTASASASQSTSTSTRSDSAYSAEASTRMVNQTRGASTSSGSSDRYEPQPTTFNPKF